MKHKNTSTDSYVHGTLVKRRNQITKLYNTWLQRPYNNAYKVLSLKWHYSLAPCWYHKHYISTTVQQEIFEDNKFHCFCGFYLNYENYFLEIFARTSFTSMQSNQLLHRCGNLTCCCTSTLQQKKVHGQTAAGPLFLSLSSSYHCCTQWRNY